MTVELKKFLSFYLADEYLTVLLECFTELPVKKGRLLLKPGQDCSYLAFVQQGCFRVYYHDLKNKEVNTWFSFPETIVTDLFGFYTSGKASFYVEALEDSILLVIKKNDLENLYRQKPALLNFGRKFAEEALTMLMERTLSLHTKSAEERYRELLQNPEFMQKIPLKYLASYLGITDTSLSRIRRSLR